jgi:hypothetical protein
LSNKGHSLIKKIFSIYKLLFRSWAEDLALTVSVDRHKDSVKSLQTWGQSFDHEITASQSRKRSTHHAPCANIVQVKKSISDPGELALKRLGSVEHLNRRRLLLRPKAATEAERPLLGNAGANGLLGVAKNGGLRKSIMNLFTKASSSHNIAKK